MTTALAWSWLRSQPESAVSGWLRQRFGGGGKRLRRIGLVAVALPQERGLPRWGRPERGLSRGAMLRQTSALVLGEAARINRPGLAKKPVHRGGRLTQAFQLSSKDA